MTTQPYTTAQASSIAAIVKQAMSDTIPNIGCNGCGRIYLELGYSKINRSSPIAKALAAISGIRITPRPYTPGVAFYMGYDNATGLIASKAEHVANRLRDAGFPAGVGYDAD